MLNLLYQKIFGKSQNPRNKQEKKRKNKKITKNSQRMRNVGKTSLFKAYTSIRLDET